MGLICWYDAAVGVSVDERGAVREWKDRSGNGHDVLTAAGVPMLAANQVNSRPAVQFRHAFRPVRAERLGADVRGAAVCRRALAPCGVEQRRLLLGPPLETGFELSPEPGIDAVLGRPIPPSRVAKRQEALRTAFRPRADHRVHGPQDRRQRRRHEQQQLPDRHGRYGASCDCDIAEILGFQTALSPAEEAAVGSYLAAKYGIAAAWPINGGKAPASPLPGGTTAVDAVRRRRGRGRLAAEASGDQGPGLLVRCGGRCYRRRPSAVQEWKDLSGHDHHARPGGGAAPLLAPRQVGPRPAVQFRKGWLALDGTFFAKEHYLVIRSPGPEWSGAGGLLGRLKGRGSSYNTWGNDTGFWQDQFPAAVTRNGIVLPGPAFDCSPLTRFMVLKIIVNAHNETEAAYAIGNNDGLAACDFDVAEILGYQSMLSPADEALVGGYLAAKYGIATAYPPLPPAKASGTCPPGEMAAVKYQGWQHSRLALVAHDAGRGEPAGNGRGREFSRARAARQGLVPFSEAKAQRRGHPLCHKRAACRWPTRSTSGTPRPVRPASGSACR